jgi:hypothetical protein
MELTIGMAVYQDFDGVYFTLQALRLYQDLEGVELLVVDNHGCSATRDFVENWVKGRYLLWRETVGTAAPRDRVFREARGEAVLCLDCHVLLEAGVIARLNRYYREHPDSFDLLQGPLLYDDLGSVATHFDPVWRAQMWGVWGVDERGLDREGEPFDIPMQGLGLFSCRKSAWPGFNPRFRGFGGEEGYLHQKFRNLGRRCLCLPWLRWVHRFPRPAGVRAPVSLEDRIHNYLIGHAEVGLDVQPVLQHFRNYLDPAALEHLAEKSLGRPVQVDPASAEAAESILGKWDCWFQEAREPFPFGEEATYVRAAEFLGDMPHIEDWGCGLGWFKRFVRPEQYRGLDGSCSLFADAIVDLCHYTSTADGILLRHVLEHNHAWRQVLGNALRSFRRKMCLVFFTPFGETTCLTHTQELAPGKVVPYYRFRKEDIVAQLRDVCSWREEVIGSETIFFLQK